MSQDAVQTDRIEESTPASDAVRDPAPAEELLVEEVSIDGMCGVY